MGDGMNEALATIIAAVIGAWAGGAFTNNKSSGFAIGLLIGAFLGFGLSNLWNFFSPPPPPATPTPTATSVSATPTPASSYINLLEVEGYVLNIKASSTFHHEKADFDCYDVKKVYDGKIFGDSDEVWWKACSEWASKAEGEGASITIILSEDFFVDHIEIYDRPNTKDQIMGGKIQLDDGESISVDAISDLGGEPAVVPIRKVVGKIKFTVTKVKPTTLNVGISEIKVIGQPHQR